MALGHVIWNIIQKSRWCNRSCRSNLWSKRFNIIAKINSLSLAVTYYMYITDNKIIVLLIYINQCNSKKGNYSARSLWRHPLKSTSMCLRILTQYEGLNVRNNLLGLISLCNLKRVFKLQVTVKKQVKYQPFWHSTTDKHLSSRGQFLIKSPSILLSI